MEYLVYFSENKVNMLYEQEYKADSETETEGEIKLGFLTLRRSRKKDNVRNRFQKLERVTSALADMIGSPFDEELPSYITDTLTMAWRTLTNTENAIYWLGEDTRNDIITKLLLIGSSRNVSGADPGSNDGTVYSTLLHFLNAYRKELEITDNGHDAMYYSLERDSSGNVKPYNMLEARQIAASRIIEILEQSGQAEPSAWTPYKFLAKCLSHEERRNGYMTERFIIATPIYVSLTE